MPVDDLDQPEYQVTPPAGQKDDAAFAVAANMSFA
jgi:hypothetical protein